MQAAVVLGEWVAEAPMFCVGARMNFPRMGESEKAEAGGDAGTVSQGRRWRGGGRERGNRKAGGEQKNQNLLPCAARL